MRRIRTKEGLLDLSKVVEVEGDGNSFYARTFDERVEVGSDTFGTYSELVLGTSSVIPAAGETVYKVSVSRYEHDNKTTTTFTKTKNNAIGWVWDPRNLRRQAAVVEDQGHPTPWWLGSHDDPSSDLHSITVIERPDGRFDGVDEIYESLEQIERCLQERWELPEEAEDA